jgi:hypothetical protein
MLVCTFLARVTMTILAALFSEPWHSTISTARRNVLPALFTVCHGLILARKAATVKFLFSTAHNKAVFPRSSLFIVSAPPIIRLST